MNSIKKLIPNGHFWRAEICIILSTRFAANPVIRSMTPTIARSWTHYVLTVPGYTRNRKVSNKRRQRITHLPKGKKGHGFPHDPLGRDHYLPVSAKDT